MRRVALFLTALLAASCGKPPPVPQPTNSGSIGIVVVTANGKQEQKLFLPQQSLDSNNLPTIVVLDATYNGTSGNPIFDTIELAGHTDGSLATATAASSSAVVAIGFNSSFVDFIDPVADKVTATVQFPTAIQNPAGGGSSFSGGGGLATGVVIDSANNRAIIAVANGFLPVDLTTHLFGTLVTAAPSENFGFWPSKDWILAPFYDCNFCSNTTPASGLQIVDMTAGQVYQLASASDGSSQVGDDPDSTDIDPTTGVVVVPDESSGTMFTLNLDKAVLSPSPDGGTFTAPLGQGPQSVVGSSFTGVAIDPVEHRALLMSEDGTGVGLMQLPSGLSDAGVNPTVALTADITQLPSGGSWSNSGDPHGVAVTVGLVSSTPVGFLVSNDNTEVARIDLNRFAAAPNSAGAVAPTDFAPLVTFIPAVAP